MYIIIGEGERGRGRGITIGRRVFAFGVCPDYLVKRLITKKLWLSRASFERSLNVSLK
jgi:hypothetical protein